MRLLLQIIKFIVGIFLTGVVHIAVSFVLPAPISYINIIFLVLVLLIFLYEHGSIIWFAAALFFMLDIVSLYPFGLSLFAGTTAATGMFILYRNIFTNRSMLAAVTLLSVGYSIYRLWFVAYIMIQAISSTQRLEIIPNIQVYILELVMTSIALIILYSIVSRHSYQLKHTQIGESWFRTLRN